ncbi:MAG: histidinol phosphate phosphatase [Nitratiruptor sp.]|nr:histidinol phosphate phosphatase [Nitratiruptor sp.]NPA83743.1 histidinol-phosphatase [Campylobacterota bacterium]
MVVDLHNHTPLCNHATGSMEQFVQEAIAKGIHLFGFSDHAPMAFDQRYRMNLQEADRYEEEVLSLRERYQGEIQILLGYEVDFLPNYLEERILKAPVDYLIGSIHFLPLHGELWGFDNPEFIGTWKSVDVDTIYQRYFQGIEAMARSGLFDIVGHIDLIKLFGHRPRRDIRLLAKGALKAIKESQMAVEINTAGMRKPVQEPYPSLLLLQEIGELDIPITFGSDAHAPDQVGLGQPEARALARELGFSKQAIFRERTMELIPL